MWHCQQCRARPQPGARSTAPPWRRYLFCKTDSPRRSRLTGKAELRLLSAAAARDKNTAKRTQQVLCFQLRLLRKAPPTGHPAQACPVHSRKQYFRKTNPRSPSSPTCASQRKRSRPPQNGTECGEPTRRRLRLRASQPQAPRFAPSPTPTAKVPFLPNELPCQHRPKSASRTRTLPRFQRAKAHPPNLFFTYPVLSWRIPHADRESL